MAPGNATSGRRLIVTTMSSFQTQSRRVLPNGVVVERLPFGFAAGRWWATFVCSLPGWKPGDPFINPRTAMSCAHVSDPEGRLQPVGGGGGGSESEDAQTWELVDHGATRAEVKYTVDGEEVSTESLTLDPTDRHSYFAARLADGSLVERLPIGQAHGKWRLRWVRSDVPRTELDDELDGDGFPPVMPHERFLRLSTTDGPLGRVDASASGGQIQFFAVQVPDTLVELRVEYASGDASAGAETLVLPSSTAEPRPSRPNEGETLPAARVRRKRAGDVQRNWTT